MPNFKNIDGYNGFYAVTKTGEVWSCRKPGRIKNKKGKWRRMKPSPHPAGHLIAGLSKDNVLRSCYVHRLVLETFVGPCPEGMECRHLDGNPRNNNLNNLEWATYQINQVDRAKHGTSNRGERCASAKLTEAEVKEIRSKYKTKDCTMAELSQTYNVNLSSIHGIIHRVTWKHV